MNFLSVIKRPLVISLIWFCSVLPCFGNEGRVFFVEKCVKCHSTLKKASPVTPIDKSSAQWKRFFKRNRHQKKEDLFRVFSPDELKAVVEYLALHAYDSTQPEVPGTK